jgi:hypothetical protein
VFQEDDRKERPFLVLERVNNKTEKVWLAVFNLETLKLVSHKQINMCRYELSFIESDQEIILVPSSQISDPYIDGK